MTAPAQPPLTSGEPSEDVAVPALLPPLESPDRPPAWAPWRNRKLMLRGAIFLAVTAIIVVGLIVWAGGSDVLHTIQGIGPEHLVLVALLTFGLTLSHAWRFKTVVRAAGFEISARRAFQLTMGAWPVSAISPSKSGDVVKAYYLRQQVPVIATLGALLAERAIDMAVLSAMALVGSLLLRQQVILLLSILLLGGMTGFFLLAPWLSRLPLKPTWKQRLHLLLASTHALWRSPALFAATVAATLVNWSLTILIMVVLFDGVGAQVPALNVAAGMPPAAIAGLAPFAIGGMGTRDSALILLFDGYANAAQSLSVGILYALFLRWLLSLAGIPFLQRLLREGS